MTTPRAQSEAGSRLSGLVPLAVFGVVVVLFIRSCLSGGLLGREQWFAPPDRGDDILAKPVGGEDAGSNGDDERGQDDRLGSSDGTDSARSGSGESSESSLPSTTLDPDVLWEMMDPVEPECPEADGSSPRYLQWTKAPSEDPDELCIDLARTYTATLVTDLGNIVIELDSQAAPETVNRFVFLARWHYYDGVEVHNAVRGELFELGDPTGRPPGSGLGPGFPVEATPVAHPGQLTDPDRQAAATSTTAGDEPTDDRSPDRQAAATSTTAPRAPTANGKPDSSAGSARTATGDERTAEPGYPRYSVVLGSPWSRYPTPGVFFVVTAEQSAMTPGPVPFGHVTQGHEVVDAIDETAQRRDGPTAYSLPIEPTVIHRVTITEA